MAGIEEHIKFNKLLIQIRNILRKYVEINVKNILFNALHPCFSIKEKKLKLNLWYFIMSETMQHWVMIDLLKKFEITKERILCFITIIQDEIYNQKYLSEKQKDFISNKIENIKINKIKNREKNT